MRISDWSSDVCASDLEEICLTPAAAEGPCGQRRAPPGNAPLDRLESSGSKIGNREDAVRLELLGVEEGVCDRLAVPSHQGAAGVLVALYLTDVISEEHTSELQSLMRIPYAVFCLQNTNATKATTQTIVATVRPTSSASRCR